MKALVLHGIGDLRLDTVKEPKAGDNEVLIAVKAAGICGSDISRVYQTGAYFYPLIPGHEFSGIVAETGNGVDAGWQGQRVGIFPLIPCNSCALCRKKQYELCRHYSYLGSRRDGGFAEYVAAPADNLIMLPDNVTFEQAAMMEPMAVAVHAMRRAVLTFSDTVAVCGLGTIGLLLLMFLKESGLFDKERAGKLLVIGNKNFQKQAAMDLGAKAECYCDGSSQDVNEWVREQTDGHGVDVFFECVGKNETFSLAVGNTAPAGRILLVGNPYSDMTLKKEVYWKILRNQLTVIGIWNSSFTRENGDDWHYVLERLAKKRIVPDRLISHRFPLEELEQGFLIMRDKTQDYGKIMGV